MKSINYKILLAFIIINTSTTLFFSYFMYWTASSIIEKNYVSSVDRTITDALNRVDMFLDKVDKYSIYITLNPEMIKIFSRDYGDNVNYPRLFAEQVNNLTVVEADILAIRYFCNDGYVFQFPPTISFNNLEELKHENLADEKEFNDSKVNWTGIYSQTYYKASDMQQNYNVFSGIRNFKESFQQGVKGILVLDICEDTLYEFIRNISFGSNGKVYIINRSGSIMTSSERDEIAGMINNYIYGIVRDEQLGASYISMNKNKILVVHNTSLKSGWTIVATTPLKDILGETVNIRIMAIFTAIVVIIISTVVSVLMSSRVTKPLRSMTKLVKQVAKGDFDVRCEVKTKDEIKELSDGFNSMISNLKELINKVYIEEIQLKQVQIENLQSKINPHFLYNTLDTIYWMLIVAKQNETARLVVALSDMLRYSISKIWDQVTIREEIKQIENYLFIQKARFRDRLTVHYDIDESILDNFILKLIIQPIVENAIKHGLECQSKNGNITIKGLEKEEGILIKIIDDGKGMDENEIKNVLSTSSVSTVLRKPGLGLNNVIERLKICYEPRYGLSIESKPGKGTCVSLFIPKVTKPGGEASV